MVMSLPTTQKRKLTEKQQSFLNNIIETKGNLKLSAELAGIFLTPSVALLDR